MFATIALLASIMTASTPQPEAITATTAVETRTTTAADSADAPLTRSTLSELPKARSSTVACAGEWERIRSLRADLDAIAAADPLSNHWPALVVGVACVTAVALIAEKYDWQPGQVTVMQGSCAALGLGLDSLLTGGDE